MGARPAANDGAAHEASWFVYVLTSASLDMTYVGITNDLDRRLTQHNGALPGGARATRRGRPWAVAATHGPIRHLAIAMEIERRVKRRRGAARIRAVQQLGSPDVDRS